MSLNPKTPMALYKANLELVLRLGTLLQENRQRWMQAGTAGTSEAIQRTLAETERMLTTNDWSALSKIPGQEFWNSMGTGTTPLHGTIETAVRSQTEFAEGLKQAFAEWQQQSAAALGGNAAQPAPWAFTDLMQAFNPAARSAASTKDEEVASKPKARTRSSASKASAAKAKTKQVPATKPRKPAKK